MTVGRGRVVAISVNMLKSLGITTVSNTPTVTKPKQSTNTGYATAASTSPRNSSSCSNNSARSAITFGSTPDSSPTRTMLTYNLLNNLGCSSKAEENAAPFRTESLIFRTVARRA
jgi:hypothetical protein